MPTPTRPSRWRRRLAAVVIGLLAAPLVAEGAARLYPPDPGAALLYNAPEGTPPDMFRYDSQNRLVPNPGFDGHFEWLDHSVRVRFDSRGLRGPEELPPEPRWLAVGDSFVLARQVEEDDTFLALLGPQVGASVLNAGMDGNGTWDNLARYVAMDPVVNAGTVLLVVFVGNDPDQDQAPAMLPRVTDPFAVIPLAPHADTADNAFARFRLQHETQPPLKHFLFRHSAVYAWWRVYEALSAKDPMNRQRHRRFQGELRAFSTVGRAEVPRLANATGEALRSFVRVAAARGDALVVAVAPPSFALDKPTTAQTLSTFGLDPATADPDALHEAVVAASRAAGANTCDLRPALAAARAEGSEPYFRFEGHWNQAGHRAVASAVAACVGKGGGRVDGD